MAIAAVRSGATDADEVSRALCRAKPTTMRWLNRLAASGCITMSRGGHDIEYRFYPHATLPDKMLLDHWKVGHLPDMDKDPWDDDKRVQLF